MTAQLANRRRVPNRIARLLAASALSSLLALPALAQQATTTDQGSTVLEAITLKVLKLWATLGGEAEADTGTTVYNADSMNLLSVAGDANSALRNSANVQYQNAGDLDAGSDSQDLVNTKPQLLSISGGKVYENNFLLNGIGINTITGTEEPFGSIDYGSELEGYEQTPNINKIYGLHPQTVFVPTEFVASTTLIDSNASARYGEFLGGVVDYKLMMPSTEKAYGSVSSQFTSDELTAYTLGTEDGTNPQNLPKPKYLQHETAAQYNLPVNDSWAILGQYSRKTADSSKTKDERYSYEETDDTSYNETYRLASRHDTDYGVFTLDGTYTNYNQEWDGADYDDLVIAQKTQSLQTRLEWQTDLTAITLENIGLKNVKLDSNIYFNKSATINDGGENETIYTAIVSRTSTSVTNPASWFYSTDPDVLSWCQVPTLTSWGTAEYCRSGGYGYKETGQEERGFKSDMTGDLLAGTFGAGIEYRETDAYRSAEEYTLYSTTRNNTTSVPYVCADGDKTCSEQQYARIKTVTPAYDNEAEVAHLGAYGELDQTWDWFNIRAGLRADYDDYFDNLNIAPRTVATIKPQDWLSVSAGYNRYYSADSLYYAVRDGQPLARAYNRTHNATTGVVGDWVVSGTQRYYNFDGSDAETPYKDEFTAALTAEDPWVEGEFRLRYLERYGKDEFIAASGGSSTDVTLTNGGESEYRSLTAEYEKSWDVQQNNLDSVAMMASLTWSKQKTTTVGAYYSEDENWAWYNNTSYNPAEFDKVRGNLDIPLRSKFDLKTSWFDDRLTAGITANVNFPYDGVRSTGDECTGSTSSSATCQVSAGSESVDKTHTIYEDFRYNTTITFDLKAAYKIAQTENTSFDVELSVYNLFNETGDTRSSDDNPWIVGRTVWLGAKATF
jgi:hypothetical protein